MAETTKVIIWGAGGHAMVVADILRRLGAYEIAGFLDDSSSRRHGQPFCGAAILGGCDRLELLREQGVTHAILAFGDCAARLKLAEVVRARGFSLVTAIHPQATIATCALIGAGSVLVAGAVVNAGATIGENVIVNTCASVDHECIVEDGVHISPGARLGGKVTIGRGAWIAIGAILAAGVKVGAGSVVGAGAVVLNDIPPGVLAYGVPAKVRRKAPD